MAAAILKKGGGNRERMRRATAVAIALSLAIALPGCMFGLGSSVEEPPEEDIGKRSFDIRKSDFDHHLKNLVRDTWRDELAWANGKGVASIEVFWKITEGRETIQLVDAAGKVVWEKTLGPGEGYDVAAAGSGERGEWKVVMDRQSVSGEVRVHAFQRASP
ncbi:MAG TPA: hypothetical protein VNZ52_12760 [Candidatus Thermoplasmatota archaeon]|nr:hypothetical protein [Candidatus Thermoplasmatota archaeon]